MVTQSTILTESPEELRRKFFSLQTAQEIAELLEIDYHQQVYHLYLVPEYKRYKTFYIPKKRGGVREIRSPITALKIMQRKLNQVLQAVYHPKKPVHGFVNKRNIMTNASPHVARRYVFNIDLEDFFTTINFGRVRGMFKGIPYLRNETVASILAQICCYDNSLPQGSPTSPVVSNMVCAKMDSDLVKLAKAHKCTYSRYADDITFSSFNPNFPLALAAENAVKQIDVGSELLDTINRNGFSINQAKTRLQTRNRRQEVTGLIVNQFVNVDRKFVRDVRAMIHDWKENTHAVAQQNFCDKRKIKNNPSIESFKYVVKGKVDFLGQVRGKKDFIYLRFCRQLKELDPELMKNYPDEPSVSKEDIDQQQTLLAQHRRNVAILLRQAAAAGIFVPLSVANELQVEREKIQRITQILRGWNVAVVEHPDDTESKR